MEDLVAERGIIVTRESIRLWCIKFGVLYSRRLNRSYPVAHREVMPEVVHVTGRYANDLAEQSREATLVRERS